MEWEVDCLLIGALEGILFLWIPPAPGDPNPLPETDRKKSPGFVAVTVAPCPHPVSASEKEGQFMENHRARHIGLCAILFSPGGVMLVSNF